MQSFKDLGLSTEVLTIIDHLGFTEPTQIQELSIPLITQGKDVIGESATGSGKTLAFGCGIIERVTPGIGIQAIILTPTRELAQQVKDELQKLSQEKKLIITTIYGGVSINPQINELRRSDVVVATPGRFLDHLQRRTINLEKVKIVVLDEADRMFDMGFTDDVERIIGACPNERQTLFFSATISTRVKNLAQKYMHDHSEVSAKNTVDPSKMTQVYYNVEKNNKLSLLIHLLRNEKSGLAMVFCNSRNTVNFVVRNLQANQLNAITIHGGLSQNKRSKMLKLFNDGSAGILVCTDVAARGLHIANVSHVYNYEIPKDAKDYVHRIGRTARAGKDGKAINLLCQYDHPNFSRVLHEYRLFKIEKVETPHCEQVRVTRVQPMRQQFQRRHFGNRHRRRR
ncbi:ATP-dependent RNA helicase [archaeon]|nr:ATP-dependent RNA helicase [archaeon]|tara:strand:+ start:176 stop:1369 length:1194 start_codon:yes stop_codon:yes gene_type:complete